MPSDKVNSVMVKALGCTLAEAIVSAFHARKTGSSQARYLGECSWSSRVRPCVPGRKIQVQSHHWTHGGGAGKGWNNWSTFSPPGAHSWMAFPCCQRIPVEEDRKRCVMRDHWLLRSPHPCTLLCVLSPRAGGSRGGDIPGLEKAHDGRTLGLRMATCRKSSLQSEPPPSSAMGEHI